MSQADKIAAESWKRKYEELLASISKPKEAKIMVVERPKFEKALKELKAIRKKKKKK